MNMRRLLDHMEEARKNREEALKTNPRYDIDRLTNKEGKVTLYFADEESLRFCLEGTSAVASTERYFVTDLMFPIPASRIEKITHGGTTAHINEVEE